MAFIRKDIGGGQVGPGTQIFGQFLHFDDLQPFIYLWQNFESRAHDVKTGLFWSEYLKG